jgi:anti-sigma factor RsiW
MNDCSEHALLLHGLIDGELDAANSVKIEAHVKTCASCAAELRRLEAIRARLAVADVRYAAPSGLLKRIDAQIESEAIEAPKARHSLGRAPVRWFAGGALTALAASLVFFLAVPQLSTRPLQDQLVASHMRSLLATHLTDVATSDRHVVKPWFNGRIDFAIPVVDLAEEGFPLVGGRLDYLEDSVVPALVYKRRLHTINLFIRPASGPPLTADFTTTQRGFGILRWTDGGLEYWAISDLGKDDLRTFQQAFRRQAARQ